MNWIYRTLAVGQGMAAVLAFSGGQWHWAVMFGASAIALLAATMIEQVRVALAAMDTRQWADTPNDTPPVITCRCPEHTGWAWYTMDELLEAHVHKET